MTESRRMARARGFGAVRQVLREDWNPVGVAGLPADEYDDYVWPLLGLLQAGADDEALLNRLREIELHWFGQAANEARLRVVVARLQSLRLAERGMPE